MTRLGFGSSDFKSHALGAPHTQGSLIYTWSFWWSRYILMANTEIAYIYCSLSLYAEQFLVVSLTDCPFPPFLFFSFDVHVRMRSRGRFACGVGWGADMCVHQNVNKVSPSIACHLTSLRQGLSLSLADLTRTCWFSYTDQLAKSIDLH